jgi:hypothetical protein
MRMVETCQARPGTSSLFPHPRFWGSPNLANEDYVHTQKEPRSIDEMRVDGTELSDRKLRLYQSPNPEFHTYGVHEDMSTSHRSNLKITKYIQGRPRSNVNSKAIASDISEPLFETPDLQPHPRILATLYHRHHQHEGLSSNVSFQGLRR